ncbi:V-type ATP synthase subunit I [Pseudochelatococcus contaminans]|uniref:V/A-type H+-transporting ATPase subunit I n=1 Tax=Pseudochelatococcus contaminans TaxID=1538103 RepID=A0A7W5Z221_9HYPH|nr:V-type ATP synthase subunit I [Pseudochelatococcus contaminans]MBB3808616.1 V/A-type H+-transporting ATPase subunit I [Pseudochelatococcus contaminans]
MTIVPMRRITLCGLIGEKEAVLSGLQDLGCVHLIPLSAPGALTTDNPVLRRRTETAFRHLEEAPYKLRPLRPSTEFDQAEVVDEIIANRARLNQLRERVDALEQRIDTLERWGDFKLPPIDDLRGQRLWFYVLPISERIALDAVELPWQIVGRGSTSLYVAIISPDEPPADILPVPRSRTGALPLSDLQEALEDTRDDIEQAEVRRTELTRWLLPLGLRLADAADTDERRAVAEQTLDDDRVFALQGWAPEGATQDLETFARDHGLALVVEEPSAIDQPPTLLNPHERVASGADLTRFYTSPGYRSWDPSLVVFVSFSFFFAMILADAGYAAIIALFVVLFWGKLGKSPATRRARVLLVALSSVAIFYGVLAGSYFGLKLPEGSFLSRFAIIDVHDFDVMMKLSVGIGVIHLSIGLGANAWVYRHVNAINGGIVISGKSLTSIGWIVSIWAGFLMWLGDGETLATGLTSLLLFGGLAAVVLGGATAQPGAGFGERAVKGAMALTGITKIFGDILSYLRLFALGLASASLAATFNSLAADIRGEGPAIYVLLSILVLLLGHGVNFGLGIMSGVVHGLRLNFIEFFGWGLSEEGYPFRAFARRAAQPAPTGKQPAHAK